MRIQNDVNKIRKNYVAEIIFLIGSFVYRYFIDGINDLSILDNYNLIQLFFIILGLSITLATFLFALSEKYNSIEDLNIRVALNNLQKSIGLEIKRITSALLVIVLLTFFYRIDIPIFKSGEVFTKYYIYDSIKIFLFLYVLFAFIDIVYTVLNLFEINNNDVS